MSDNNPSPLCNLPEVIFLHHLLSFFSAEELKELSLISTFFRLIIFQYNYSVDLEEINKKETKPQNAQTALEKVREFLFQRSYLLPRSEELIRNYTGSKYYSGGKIAEIPFPYKMVDHKRKADDSLPLNTNQALTEQEFIDNLSKIIRLESMQSIQKFLTSPKFKSAQNNNDSISWFLKKIVCPLDWLNAFKYFYPICKKANNPDNLDAFIYKISRSLCIEDSFFCFNELMKDLEYPIEKIVPIVFDLVLFYDYPKRILSSLIADRSFQINKPVLTISKEDNTRTTCTLTVSLLEFSIRQADFWLFSTICTREDLQFQSPIRETTAPWGHYRSLDSLLEYTQFKYMKDQPKLDELLTIAAKLKEKQQPYSSEEEKPQTPCVPHVPMPAESKTPSPKKQDNVLHGRPELIQKKCSPEVPERPCVEPIASPTITSLDRPERAAGFSTIAPPLLVCSSIAATLTLTFMSTQWGIVFLSQNKGIGFSVALLICMTALILHSRKLSSPVPTSETLPTRCFCV